MKCHGVLFLKVRASPLSVLPTCSFNTRPRYVPSPVAVSVLASRLVVPDRLGNAKVKQADSNPRGEKHREESNVSELWLVVRFTELQLGVLREKQIGDECEPRIFRRDVEPSPRVGHPNFRAGQVALGRVRLHDAPDHEAPDDHRRQKRDYGVDIHPQRSPASLEGDALGTLVVLLFLLLIRHAVVQSFFRLGMSGG